MEFEAKMRVLVLGSTGMLGQAVMSELKRRGLDPVGVSRTTSISFDAMSQTFESLMRRPFVGRVDAVVNCIGWIPQKASDDEALNTLIAHRLNVSLVEEIASYTQVHDLNWIQIGTDCIYDGLVGNYHEDSVSTPTDLYSRTKYDGEEFTASSIFIRCSIVGPDVGYKTGLYEWFKRMRVSGDEVQGYENHFWNGVTTNAFARLAAGLIETNWTQAIKVHWIPRGTVTKADLLRLFCKYLEGEVTGILPFEAPREINRTLGSKQESLISRLWSIAGYETIPTIEELVSEMVEAEKRVGDG